MIAVLVSRLQASLEREHRSARMDPLTGLSNGRAFMEAAPAQMEVCRRQGWPLVFAYVDLDNFKQVNDEYGHRKGDEALRLAASTMRSELRRSDLLARFGGDEFVLLLPNVSESIATELLERVRRSVQTAMSSRSYPVTASIGAIAVPVVAVDFEKILHEADQTMYEVKNSGKNQVLITVFVDRQSNANWVDA
jgi:diguanylate cyclase (GGDEF)-like protein